MSPKNHLPDMVSARLAPFASVDPVDHGKARAVPEDLDVEASLAVAPHSDRRLRLGSSLKLLFAALGAGNGVVPMGDNGRATRRLAEYAESLRRH